MNVSPAELYSAWLGGESIGPWYRSIPWHRSARPSSTDDGDDSVDRPVRGNASDRVQRRDSNEHELWPMRRAGHGVRDTHDEKLTDLDAAVERQQCDGRWFSGNPISFSAPAKPGRGRGRTKTRPTPAICAPVSADRAAPRRRRERSTARWSPRPEGSAASTARARSAPT